MNKCSHRLSVLAPEELLSGLAERKTNLQEHLCIYREDWLEEKYGLWLSPGMQNHGTLHLKDTEEVMSSTSPTRAATTQGEGTTLPDPQGCFIGS